MKDLVEVLEDEMLLNRVLAFGHRPTSRLQPRQFLLAFLIGQRGLVCFRLNLRHAISTPPSSIQRNVPCFSRGMNQVAARVVTTRLEPIYPTCTFAAFDRFESGLRRLVSLHFYTRRSTDIHTAMLGRAALFTTTLPLLAWSQLFTSIQLW